MRESHLKYLACPVCQHDLAVAQIQEQEADRIKEGLLRCTQCAKQYSIVRFVPRFVPLENYASNFGYQWTTHARTQLDSYTGSPISATRFFEETCWPRRMDGEGVLEVGSGAGRFTEVVASTGAMVVSVDYSYAVEANYQSNGHYDNLLIVQADIYSLPLKIASFERVFCLGVLQHTPDPTRSFLKLAEQVKPGGHIAVDVYPKRGFLMRAIKPRRWVRTFTRHVSPEKLYSACKRYVEAMWPLASVINRIPKIGWRITNSVLLIADYRGLFDLPPHIMREWAVLDTFDALAPAYENNQMIDDVRHWFVQAGLENIDVEIGFRLIVGRASRPNLTRFVTNSSELHDKTPGKS